MCGQFGGCYQLLSREAVQPRYSRAQPFQVGRCRNRTSGRPQPPQNGHSLPAREDCPIPLRSAGESPDLDFALLAPVTHANDRPRSDRLNGAPMERGNRLPLHQPTRRRQRLDGPMMSSHLLLVLLVSLTSCAFIVSTQRWHTVLTGDLASSGVQKIHSGSTPRIGGLPIYAASAIGCYLLLNGAFPFEAPGGRILLSLLTASAPVVLLGLIEDMSKRISPVERLLAATASGGLGIYIFGATVNGIGLPAVDAWFSFALISVPFTLLMVGGFTNAMNIVDGLNGLASGLALVMLIATGAVAQSLGDAAIVQVCLTLGVATAGFLVLNYPRGSIFLGDGGAYFLGFTVVQLWIVLINRHPSISPWFMVAVGFYPTMETIFSMYRRRFRGVGGTMQPDRLHLHSLVYRRWAVPLTRAGKYRPAWAANSLAATSIVVCAAVPVALAVWKPNSSSWNALVVVAAALVYLLAFSRFVCFKRFRWGRRSKH